jgi:hypothetical protein
MHQEHENQGKSQIQLSWGECGLEYERGLWLALGNISHSIYGLNWVGPNGSYRAGNDYEI